MKFIATLYAIMDKRPLRALSLLMALLLAGCIFWDPSRFAAKTSELEIWHGFLLMWAVCSGVIHGVGFRPRAVHWQGIFCPLIADIVLALGLFFFLLLNKEISVNAMGLHKPIKLRPFTFPIPNHLSRAYSSEV